MLDHLDDIASDLSAVHRVDDMWQVPARRLFGLVERLPYYEGVMRMHALAEASSRPERSAKDITAATVAMDPVLSKIISVGDPNR